MELFCISHPPILLVSNKFGSKSIAQGGMVHEKTLFENLVFLSPFQEAARGSLPYQVSVQLNYNDRKVCMNK